MQHLQILKYEQSTGKPPAKVLQNLCSVPPAHLGFLIHASRDKSDPQWLLQVIMPGHQLGKSILQNSFPPDTNVKERDHHGMNTLKEGLHGCNLLSQCHWGQLD